MSKVKFAQAENRTLSEVYRRLNKFHKGNVNAALMLLAYPGECKTLIQKDYLFPYSKEIKRAPNWYSLTNKGKELMSKHINPNMSEDESLKIFMREKIIDFSVK